MMLWIIISVLVIIWLITGAVCYAASFAHLQGSWPLIAAKSYRSDRIIGVVFGLAGPIGLLAVIMSCMLFKRISARHDSYYYGNVFHYGLKWR